KPRRERVQLKLPTHDAIVVGSGISGGWAAKELTERGLTVLLLERGKNIEHIRDYVNAQKGPWEYSHRARRTQDLIRRHPILQRARQLNEKNSDWWVNEEESPYTEAKRFDWYRGYHVGGRSLMWARCSFRLSDIDFAANVKEGVGTDWPIRYTDIAPWYSHVERFAGISGSREGLPQLPDGDFQPAMPLNCAEQFVAESLTTKFGGQRRLIPSRTANLTVPLPGRGACQYRNACGLGCPYGAYFSTQSSTLPAAMKTGRVTLQPFAIVTEVLYDKYLFGGRPNPSYVPRYRNLLGDKRPYLRGFGYEGGAGRDGWSRAVAELGVGGAFKDRMCEPGQWSIGGTGFGEMLPNHEKTVTLDPERKDKWGLPVLKIDCATGENERLMRIDMASDMAEMLAACGVK